MPRFSEISPAGLLATVRGIVVVRPELRVVVEALELEDLVFGLDVAVFGDADVDADPRLVDVRPIQPGVANGLVGAVDADAAGPRAAAHFFAFLVAQLVEIADAGQRLADVADFVGTHAAAAGEQAVAEFGQIVAVGRGQADAGNDDPVVIGPLRVLPARNHGAIPADPSASIWFRAFADRLASKRP